MAPPLPSASGLSTSAANGLAFSAIAVLTASNVASLPTASASSSAVPTTVAPSDITSVIGSMVETGTVDLSSLSPADLQLIREAETDASKFEEYFDFNPTNGETQAPRMDVDPAQS
ncbi:hypothetical protein B0H10DRAFT_2434147 [Mycena sp. CBHHK59/15]|nr:hypothetical protein B0H10DRAFT_2434147 [Mycena sp. CBHHK59/15]